MIEIKQKSVLPVYGVAVVWILYCLLFPLYKTWHFIIPVCAAVLTYVLLSVIFPGKTKRFEVPAEPIRTGNESIDALLAKGESAVSEMRSLRDTIPDDTVRGKIDEIIVVIDKIFKNLLDDPNDYNQVKRFADFYLPATIKLLQTYNRFSQSGASGENITTTMARINIALDTVLVSYRKFFDSLFENQAIDIETDIRVLENMLKSEGLLNPDFGN
jgi:hypothetical protein